MTDFFVSQFITLILILVYLVKPFFKSFSQTPGLEFFPAIAFFLQILIVLGQGFGIDESFYFFLSFFVFLLSLPRLIRLNSNLKTDWYSRFSIGANIFFIVIWVFLFGALFFTGPCNPPELSTPQTAVEESGYFYETKWGGYSLEKEEHFQMPAGIYTIWYPENPGTKKIPVILYVQQPGSSQSPRRTASSVLAGNGYFVVTAEFFDSDKFYSAPLMRAGFLRTLILQWELVLFNNQFSISIDEGIFQGQYKVKGLKRLLNTLQVKEDIPLINTENFFYLLEGNSVPLINEPDFTGFKGVAVLPFNDFETEHKILKLNPRDEFPVDFDSYNILSLVEKDSKTTAFGECELYSPLFSTFAGTLRDKKGERAQFIGQKIRVFFDAVLQKEQSGNEQQ